MIPFRLPVKVAMDILGCDQPWSAVQAVSA